MLNETNKIPIFETIFLAFSSIWRFGRIYWLKLLLALLTLLPLIAWDMGLFLEQDSEQNNEISTSVNDNAEFISWMDWLVSILYLSIVYTFVAIPIHRAIILGKESIKRSGFPFINIREVKFVSLVILFLVLLFSIQGLTIKLTDSIYKSSIYYMFYGDKELNEVSDSLKSTIVNEMLQAPIDKNTMNKYPSSENTSVINLITNTLGPIGLIVLILLAAPLIVLFLSYFLGRTALVMPSAAINQNVSLLNAWKMSKSNGVRIGFLIGLFPLLFFILLFILFKFLLASFDYSETFSEDIVLYFFSLFMVLIEIALLSHIYIKLVYNKERNKLPRHKRTG